MHRNNFLPHVALALVLIMVAAFAGQIRKWKWRRHSVRRAVVTGPYVKPRLEIGTEQGKLDKTEIFVRFHSGVSQEEIQNITARLHDRVEDETEAVPGLDLIEDEDGITAEALVREYRALREVEYAEPVFRITTEPFLDATTESDNTAAKPVVPNDPRFHEQWALANEGQNSGKSGADISALRAWKTTTGSDQIVVAVLDSGVDYKHPDLEKNIWTRPENIKAYRDQNLGEIDDVRGYNAIDNDSDPMDDNGHGTHCAGIIGAEGGNGEGITGVNWTVKIMPLKFMDATGSGTTKDAIEAINYVIDRKQHGVNVRIISASWGSTEKSRALEDVIRKAYEEDILFVAASGNSSVNTDTNPHYPSSYNVGNVISVAALDRNDQLASFSNFGPKSVHIAAPGKEILSTWLDNGFREASGTSMATPMVAGVAALVLAENPRMPVDELRKRLLDSVDKLPAVKGKVLTGGRINAAKAVGGQWKL
jgi:subtilisin family serine protease